MSTKHQIVIIGGGNAGISVAAQFLKKDASLDIAIIDGANKHYYQPAWTMVGGGFYDINNTVRDESTVIPENAHWIKENVISFQPEQNTVTLKSGVEVHYDYLVVAPGIQLNWNEIKGLEENLGKNGVCSNYSFSTAPYTYTCLKIQKRGKQYSPVLIHPLNVVVHLKKLCISLQIISKKIIYPIKFNVNFGLVVLNYLA